MEEGTVPAVSFKMEILAANVNFKNMDKQAFFNILGTPFELQDRELQEILKKNSKKFDPKVDHFFTFTLKLKSYLLKFVDQQEVLSSGG